MAMNGVSSQGSMQISDEQKARLILSKKSLLYDALLRH